MDIYFRTTSHGFLRGDFGDANGERCSVQESSVATEPMLWLGQDHGTHYEHEGLESKCCARMHLTQEHARCLAGLLQYFADHGELPPSAENV